MGGGQTRLKSANNMMMVNYETSHCGKLCQWRFEHKRKYFGRITLHASRHYHTIIGIQRIRQHKIKIALLMSWATIFCAPHQLLGNDLCELGNVFFVFLCYRRNKIRGNKNMRTFNSSPECKTWDWRSDVEQSMIAFKYLSNMGGST